MNMQKTEYRCVGGCVGGWGNDSLVLTLVRQKKTTFSGTCLPQVAPQAQVVPQKVMSPLLDSALLSFWES